MFGSLLHPDGRLSLNVRQVLEAREGGVFAQRERKNQGGEWVGWIFFIADAEDAWIFFYSPKLGLFIADHIGCLIL